MAKAVGSSRVKQTGKKTIVEVKRQNGSWQKVGSNNVGKKK